MFNQHHRFAIWNANQHPYKHDLSEYTYTSGALPGVTSVGSAIDWIINVLYPTPKAAVANPAALPSVGNSIGDYRVVLNDGDGKSAGYRWEQREGDVAAKWYKIYDMDFGAGSVLQQAMSNAQELFVQKFGNDDLDSAGVALTGVNAGQHIYGGLTANNHLTLHANSGDGVGATTGYIQIADHLRPTVANTFDLGTSVNTIRDIYSRYHYVFEGSSAQPGVIGRSGSGFETTGMYWASNTLGFSVSATSILELSTTTSILRNQNFSIAKGVSGAPVTFTVTNSSNTASSQTIIDILMAGTTAASPIIRWSNGVSGNQWSAGMDQGDSFKWKLSQNSNVGSNDFLTMSTAGAATIGAASSTQNHVTIGNSFKLTKSQTSILVLGVTNSDNTNAASHSAVRIESGGASAGDAEILMTVGATDWASGIDNSDSDKYKISNGTSLGTNDFLTITTGGVACIPAGSLAIGTSSPQTIVGLRLTSGGSGITTGISQFGMYVDLTFTSSATTEAHNIHSQINTVNSAFTLPIASAFNAATAAKGAANTITRLVNYYGTMQTAGTNNAFISDNASFTGNYFINQSGTDAIVFGASSVKFSGVTTTASAANAFLDNAAGNNLLRSTSSARYKKNIENLQIDSSKIFSLRPVEFDDKNSGSHHFGLVAEEVAKELPLLVHWSPEKAIDPDSVSDVLVPDAVQYQLLSVLLLTETKKMKASYELNVEETSAKMAELKLSLEDLRPARIAPIPAYFEKGKWFGSDAGSEKEPLRHLFLAGEAKGLRLENVEDVPESLGRNKGRLVFTNGSVHVDTGATFKKLSVGRVEVLIKIDGNELSTEIDFLNTELSDARKAIFQLVHNSEDFERVVCKIKTPTASRVVIDQPLPAGSYRLIGIE